MSDDMVKSSDVEVVDHELHLGEFVDPDDEAGRLIDAYTTTLTPDDAEPIPGIDPAINPDTDPADGTL